MWIILLNKNSEENNWTSAHLFNMMKVSDALEESKFNLKQSSNLILKDQRKQDE